jgi:CheY-like chemotaxis protein
MTTQKIVDCWWICCLLLVFQVQEAEGGQNAISRCQSWLPHLVWMDLRMPGVDGYEATRQIKAIASHTPIVIALTGSAFEEDRSGAIGCKV